MRKFVSLLILIALAASFFVERTPGAALAGPLPVTDANPGLVRTFTDDEGRQIDEVQIAGRPPVGFRAPAVALPKDSIDGASNVLTGVPAFDWTYGCSPTSAAMLFGYYDTHGYPNMYAGPANSGVCPLTNSVWGPGQTPIAASHIDIDGRTAKGSVEDYWGSPDPYIGVWPEHTSDSTTDFMGTSQSKYGNPDGSTTFFSSLSGTPLVDYTAPAGRMDGCHGMRLFAESRGYTVETNFTQYIAEGPQGRVGGFTFEDFKSEIDAGRPVLIHVTSHSMLGYGYNISGNTIYVHDTWDYQDHTMEWGGTYPYYGGVSLQQYAVTVLRLAPAGATYTLSTGQVGSGTVSKDPSRSSYDSGTSVTLTATPAPGWTFAGWSGSLTGSANPASITMDADKTVIASFTEGPISSLITRYYSSILDRSPDEPGRVYWFTEITRIQSLGIDVREGFIALARLFFTSPEYLAKNTTPAAYITDLYETFFNRTPDPVTEVAYWTGLMAAGMSRDITMNWFVYSPEYATYMTSVLGSSITRPENNLVNDLYRGFLNRLPDTTGFTAQLNAMRAAQASDAAAVRSTTLAIALNFMTGPEYALRARTNTQFIEDCYNGILRRGALAAEIQGWVDLLTAGATRTEVLTGFVNSPEFQLRVDQVIAAGPFIP